MVMTRLILNDMVKVKGQISEIAACLVDKEDQIKQLAAQFFSELANKVIFKYTVSERDCQFKCLHGKS